MSILIQSRIIGFGLLLFLLPWFLADHYSPWNAFPSEALSLFGILFLSVGLLINRNRITIPKIMGWVVFAGLLPWFQYAIGISFFAGDALLASLYCSGLLLAILFGFTSASADPRPSIDGVIGLAHVFWIAALISAAIGLVQWLGLQEPLGMYVVQVGKGARAMGNLGQPNQLATLLLMGVTALAYLYETNVIGKLALFLAVTFITAVLVLTQSRAGLISVLVVSAFGVWKLQTVGLRLSRNAVLGWLTGFIVGTLRLPYLSEILMIGDSRNIAATESVSERLLIWKQVAYAIAQAPWLGYGWNQTPTASVVGSLAFPGVTHYAHAHNIMLDLLAWCGVPIGILLIVVMTYWLASRLRALNRPKAIFAMAGLLPMAVHSLLEYPFAYAYFLIAAGFMVGVVEAGYSKVKTFRLDVSWLWGFIVIWTALGGYMAYEYLLIEEDFRVVRFENLNLGTTPSTYEVPNIKLLSHMGAMLKAARQPLEPNTSDADIENLRKVSDRFIYGAIRCRYAMVLGLNGNPDGATQQLKIIQAKESNSYYTACTDKMRRLEIEKYPQLAAVLVP